MVEIVRFAQSLVRCGGTLGTALVLRLGCGTNAAEREKMKIVLNVVGFIFIAMGGVWFLQGINVLPGSFMTGQIRWAIYGGIAVAAGIVLARGGQSPPLKVVTALVPAMRRNSHAFALLHPSPICAAHLLRSIGPCILLMMRRFSSIPGVALIP